MLGKLLIDKEALSQYRPIAELDEERITPLILEVQNKYLRTLLGEPLYVDLMNNSETEKYQDLLNGKDYTYQSMNYHYDGLVPMLCYFVLAAITVSFPINYARFGLVTKVVNGSQPVDPSMLKREHDELESSALSHMQYTKDFLDKNSTTYTLWKGGINTTLNKTTGLNFFKL